MLILDLLHRFGVVSIITPNLFLPGFGGDGSDAPRNNSSGRPCRYGACTSHIQKPSIGQTQAPIRNLLIYLGQIVVPMGCQQPSMHSS